MTGGEERRIVKAQDVLRRYADGERDFRNTNLRGANFKGQDLSGADFSGADIRSANFKNATLREVNFAHVQAGSQKRWFLLQVVLTILLSVITGALQGFSGALIARLLNSSQRGEISGYIAVFILVGVLVILAWRGFTRRSFGSLILSIASVFVLTFAIAVFIGLAGNISVQFSTAIAIAAAGAVAMAITFAVVVSSTIVGSTYGASVSVGTCFVAIVTAGVVAELVELEVSAALSPTLILAGLVLIFSLYVILENSKENEKFSAVRLLGLAITSIGGTSFCGANLATATFRQAYLKSTNFTDDDPQRPTTLTHVCWLLANTLNHARLGNSILKDRRVRTLLTTLEKGHKQDLSDANLRGANLNGVTLENAILRRATLSNALLNQVILKGAILSETQAINADFTGACLTGATLESWNIDSTTTFKNIDCQYVFLREHPDDKGNRERRPHNPDKIFQPGDFKKFFKEMLDDVQILIRNGIEPVAFRAAFQKIMAEHPTITQDAIQSLEKKGADMLMTLQVPESLDKAQLEQDWDAGYQAGLTAGKDAGRLESADKIEQLAFAMAQNSTTIYNQNTNQNSNKNIAGDDQSQTIDIQGDVSQSSVSLGDENQIANSINPLGDDD